ncbi:MAG TPA: DNA polymerase III subunit beta [Candidatus Limnocylindrales bacterium]
MITGSVTVKPQAFAAAVKWAAKFLDARPSVPIWAGLMLEAGDGTLRITAVNENVSAVAAVPVDGDGKGRTVVSGRLLGALVGTFTNADVTISGETETLTLVAGRWTGTLPTMSEDDYPAVPDVPATIGTVSGDEFSRVVAEAAAATSKDTDKAANWRSILLTFGESEVRAIASDSLRAAGASAGFSRDAGEVGETALLLADAMVDVAAGFIGPDRIEVGLSGTQLALSSATRSVVMRMMAGAEYPAAVISGLITQERPEHAVVTVADLTRPLKRAALMRDKDGPVAIRFTAGMMTIASSGGDVKRAGDEEIDVVYDGPEVTLHFNPGYLADALNSAPGEQVDIGLTDKTGRGGRPEAVVLTVPGTEWRHVLMPIRPVGK